MLTLTEPARGAACFTTPENARQNNLTSMVRFSPDLFEHRKKWDLLIDKLLGLRNLQDDWDGEGAPAPSPPIVDGAIKLAAKFKKTGVLPASRVLAGVNGTVLFEWQWDNAFCEIEVVAPDLAEMRYAMDHLPTQSESDLINI